MSYVRFKQYQMFRIVLDWGWIRNLEYQMVREIECKVVNVNDKDRPIQCGMTL